jgi:hypothetical protein
MFHVAGEMGNAYKSFVAKSEENGSLWRNPDIYRRIILQLMLKK